jgi:alpha-tubulin suppressor-like RCC1 family protein
MRSGRVGWSCASALVLAACGSDSGIGPGPDPVPSVVVVSNAVAGPTDTGTVWVSLPPGTVPAGVDATVTTDLAQGTAMATMLDGGFDPVALPALNKDTVVVVVHGASGEIATFIVPVPMKAPPIVVRTYPPKSKKDVPLNLRALVVFSEPMDRQTLTTGTVHLLKDGQPVAGSVVVSPDGTRVEFLPFALLAGTTDYVLEVTTGARDASGDPLAEPISVSFTTETPSLAPVAKVTLDPDSAFLRAGATRNLVWRLTDSTGNAVYRPMTWSSSDPSVVTVDPAGSPSITALRAGEATISLTSEGVSGTAYIRVTLPSSWTMVAAGSFHACAVADDDLTYCWGNDYQGHLGTPPNEWGVEGCRFGVNGQWSCLTIPSPVTFPIRLTALALGQFYSCGLTAGGTAYCWGRLPPQLYPTRLRPEPMAPGLTFTGLTAGAAHVCGLTAAGQAWCWGENTYGQLGNGTHTDQADPVLVLGGQQFVAINAWWRQTCAIDVAGQAWCWGENTYGQLGNGTSGGDAATPVMVTGGLQFASIATGFRHSCGLASDGTAWCWGDNTYGALGAGSSVVSSATPVAVQTALRFTTLDAGDGWTCGLDSGGHTAWCWGQRHDGFGEGVGQDYTPQPSLDWSTVPFTGLTMGMDFACGMTAVGTLHCWGDDYGAATRPFRR